MSVGTKKIIWSVTGFLLFVSVVVLYMTHRVIPFMMDDLWYSTILSEETPLQSLGDIVRSQIWHYQNWGGRSMTHSILQLTLLAGEKVADILNVLMTLLLSGTACLLSRQKSLPAFFAAMAMMLSFNANWVMSMFWQAGAANYLYITVFILLFLFCYLRELPDQRKEMPSQELIKSGESKPLFGITFWIVPLGILTGWSNENMGPAAWIMSAIVIAFAMIEKRKVKLWMILGNISCLLGSVMVIVAPGNFVRSKEAAENQYGVLWRLFLRCYAESKALLEFLFPTLFTLALILFVGKCVLHISIGRRNVVLMLGALLSWGAMILSPHYPDRASFGTMMLLICVILSMAGRIWKTSREYVWPMWAAVVFIWLRGMLFCGEYLCISWGWIL